MHLEDPIIEVEEEQEDALMDADVVSGDPYSGEEELSRSLSMQPEFSPRKSEGSFALNDLNVELNNAKEESWKKGEMEKVSDNC